MSKGAEVRFHLHLGRRHDESSEPAEATQGWMGKLPRVTQVLALAIHIQDQVNRGEVEDFAEYARQRFVSRERISQVMKLVWLAPDIQMEILYLPPTPGGRYPISEQNLRRIGEMLSWEDQRAAWQQLKREKKLMLPLETKRAAGD